MPLHYEDAVWPLALATMAGLSTSIGAVVAVVRRPSAQAMAALLGLALGVMACVSIVELVVRNAMSGESDPLLILAAAGAGALTYYVAEPFFPKMDEGHDHLVKKQDDVDDHEAFFRHLQQEEAAAAAARASSGGGPTAGGAGAGGGAGGGSHHHHHHHVSDADLERSAHGGAVALGLASGGASQRKVTTAAGAGGASGAGALGLPRKGSGAGDLGSPLGGGSGLPGGAGDLGLEGSGHGGEPGGLGLGLGGAGHAHAHAQSESQRLKAGRMMRLGLLMAVTMTIHNLPEGFAVAFSAFTDFGPVMAIAIALHNIPEGVIIAAPIFAATGSRWKAIGIATASGLSEPLGALLSLLLLQPFFTQERLHYLLAFTGGVMLAVCGIELWPEGRNCRHDRAFAAGILGGVAVMGWTLYVEGTFEAAAAAAAAAGHPAGQAQHERQLLAAAARPAVAPAPDGATATDGAVISLPAVHAPTLAPAPLVRDAAADGSIAASGTGRVQARSGGTALAAVGRGSARVQPAALRSGGGSRVGSGGTAAAQLLAAPTRRPNRLLAGQRWSAVGRAAVVPTATRVARATTSVPRQGALAVLRL